LLGFAVTGSGKITDGEGGCRVCTAADLTEELVDLSASALHPCPVASLDVFRYCAAEVLHNLKETTCVRIVRDEEAQEAFCFIETFFQREKVVVIGEEGCAENDGRVED
jgi:hypothetical protein